MTLPDLAAVGLDFSIDGPVATVTLNRPDVRNAQTPAMWRALAALGREIPDEVRVVVVAGAGPTFSAGLDRAMLDPSTEGQESVIGLLALSDEDATARLVGAREAVDIGLANLAVPVADLDATVADLAAALATPRTDVVTETKLLLQGAAGRSLDEQRRLEREAQIRRFRALAG